MTVTPHVVRRGEGVPIVAVHGNGVDHRLLLALDDDLAAAGSVERIYLDLPGFGGTPALDGDGGLPELADWLVATVRELVGSDRFALLGNSLGGLLARHVAAQLPDQVLGLALLAPVVDPEPSHRTTPEHIVLERDDDLLATLTADDREEFAGVTVRQVPAVWESYAEHALPGIRAADPRAMERLSRRYVLTATPETPGTTTNTRDWPTLIVAGRQDHVVGHLDQAELAALYLRATYLAVDAAGHNVHLEQPELVGDAVRDWARILLV
ncbi:alpha/beta fold hydrolase [Georgenia sp. Z1344]|uniref:alpha/beta fold hydrolase n=1 Tax=Georgenia sp. Z1344 TaxID=3416706 RepID=UPI003CF399B8